MKKHVLVTTEFRGVFAGEIIDDSQLPYAVTLKNCRNCISWETDMQGFLGLATFGPNDKCKIGAKVNELTLYKITSVAPLTEEAQSKWENAKWNE